MGKLFSGGPLLEKGASPSSETTFFQKKATPSYCISVACLQRRLFSQIHESWEEAMASTACPFRTGGKKDVFSTLASLFAFSRASFSNSVWSFSYAKDFFCSATTTINYTVKEEPAKLWC